MTSRRRERRTTRAARRPQFRPRRARGTRPPSRTAHPAGRRRRARRAGRGRACRGAGLPAAAVLALACLLARRARLRAHRPASGRQRASPGGAGEHLVVEREVAAHEAVEREAADREGARLAGVLAVVQAEALEGAVEAGDGAGRGEAGALADQEGGDAAGGRDDRRAAAGEALEDRVRAGLADARREGREDGVDEAKAEGMSSTSDGETRTFGGGSRAARARRVPSRSPRLRRRRSTSTSRLARATSTRSGMPRDSSSSGPGGLLAKRRRKGRAGGGGAGRKTSRSTPG